MAKERRLFEKRFFIAWLMCSLTLYGASYAWHGLFLNDLQKITYPLDLVLMAFALVYLVTGLVITLLVKFVPIEKPEIFRGVLFGAGSGFFLYLVAFAFGISFYAAPALEYIVFDLSWQVLEGSIGGLVCGVVYQLATRMSRAIRRI